MKQTQTNSKTEIDEPKKQDAKELPFEDDRYPGSFFKVPGVPQPGKTGWRIS